MSKAFWAYPRNAMKSHYFVGRISLCKRRSFSGKPIVDQDDHDEGPSEDFDYKICWLKRQKMKKGSNELRSH